LKAKAPASAGAFFVVAAAAVVARHSREVLYHGQRPFKRKLVFAHVSGIKQTIFPLLRE
jgi:hypothetical protein